MVKKPDKCYLSQVIKVYSNNDKLTTDVKTQVIISKWNDDSLCPTQDVMKIALYFCGLPPKYM